uniref:NADH-ubiquinone oxidoreductase chain 2 n=1 Tax=Epigonichthys cultellus TaxID=1355229 RepID=A0A0E3D818_9BRAN|nr:NADH dehydrogenase subunit 2 [Epigonichthys cultellus]AGQ42768.1 NADH dehydrogenase subunit 2 [Epigonichthys cultellus]BAV13782.1 NADH dehydrogenase subunit 2 [Epigonichthys cultellus]
MSPYISPLFSLSMLLSVILVMCANHWVFMWLGLELGTLAFVPLLTWWHSPLEIEATVKYFIMQALAAALFFFGGLVTMNLTQMSGVTYWFSETILVLAIFIKLGVVPFHYWVVDVIQGLNYLPGMVLLTWQKLPGLMVLVQLGYCSAWIILSLGCLSALVGGVGGLGQTQLRKLLAFSSIVHLGWLVVGVTVSSLLGMIYFFLYVGISLPVFMLLHILGAVHVNHLRASLMSNSMLSMFMAVGVLSLAGLPPFLGFLGKWLLVTAFVEDLMILVALSLVIGTLISLYYYLRISYLCLVILSPQQMMVNMTWRKTLTISLLSGLIVLNVVGLLLSGGVACIT